MHNPKTINRTALFVIPKQPYFDWANSFKYEVVASTDDRQATTYLIPDKYDEFNFEKYLKKNFSWIFEGELEAWMTDPDAWPQNRTYKEFKKWFDVVCSDIIWDYGEDDIEYCE